MAGDKFLEVSYEQEHIIGDSYKPPDGCAELSRASKRFNRFWCQPYAVGQEGKEITLGPKSIYGIGYRESGDPRYPRDPRHVKVQVSGPDEPMELNPENETTHKCRNFTGEEDYFLCKTIDGERIEIDPDHLVYLR